MPRPLLKLALGIIFVSMAFFLGSSIGKYWGQKQKLDKRTQISENILAENQSIDIGDTLADHVFEEIGGDTVSLSKLLYEKSVIVVFIPDCQGCKDEIMEMKKALKSSEDAQFFIYISWGNPRHIQEMKNEHEIDSPMLYDHRKSYFSRYDVFTFPFNIIVDRNGVVLDLLAGSMLKEEFEEIIEFNKQASFMKD